MEASEASILSEFDKVTSAAKPSISIKENLWRILVDFFVCFFLRYSVIRLRLNIYFFSVLNCRFMSQYIKQFSRNIIPQFKTTFWLGPFRET